MIADDAAEALLGFQVGRGRTKYNRARNGYPKAHWIAAAAVGVSGATVRLYLDHRPLLVKANGWGCRQMCATDKYGFPKQHRTRV